MPLPSHASPDGSTLRRRRTTSLVAVLAALVALAGAMIALPAPHAQAADDRALDVVASEFAFEAPDTVAAGRVRLRLTNRGQEMHLLEVARLADGHTAEELAAHLAARRAVPAWATFVGGPFAPLKGARPVGEPSDGLAVTIDLAPGRYALLCPIPSPDDHKAHLAKGMVRTLVVTPAPAAGVARPSRERGARTARVVLDDYGFLMDPAWRAGRTTLRVENRAEQAHELVVFRLEPGKRAVDVVRWARTLTGPPPGTLVAGTTALGHGRTATLDLSLTSGAYALLCFLPDATDGRSHVQHGMTRDLTVP
jgi:hypothetical protein